MFSQTFFELRFSLGNEGKDGKNLNSQTWPETPRRPSSRHPRPSYLRCQPLFLSCKKKEPKPKLFGPDIFQWGRGLPRERVGAKKFDMSLEAREIKLFGRDIPGFCRDIRGRPEKFEKKKVCVQFSFPILSSSLRYSPPKQLDKWLMFQS